MNERIREFAVAASGYEVAPHDFLFRQEQIQKFALLIVRECIDIIEKLPPGYKDYRDQIEDAFRIASVVEIKQRFGVK
jgi:hypothetical protein